MIAYRTLVDAGSLARQALMSFASGDLESFVRCFDRDATLHLHFGPLPGFPGQVRGHDAIREYFQQRERLTPIRRVCWTMVLSSAHDFVLFGVSEYTDSRGLRAEALPAAVWYKVADDHIVEGHSYVDSAGLSRLRNSVEPDASPANAARPPAGGFSRALLEAMSVPAEMSGPATADFEPLLAMFAEAPAGMKRRSLAGLLEPNIEWYGCSPVASRFGALARGQQQAARYLEDQDGLCRWASFRLLDTFQVQDTVALRTEMSAVSPATGRPVVLHGIYTLTMREGRIVRALDVFDSLSLELALKAV